MRKVTVISAQKNQPIVYNTAATTWGQLKEVISRDFSNLGDQSATIKETRNNLTVTDAQLPTGDFTLFLTQSKIKAGAVDMKQVLEAIKEGYIDVFDEVLERLEEGEFDVANTADNAVVSGSSARISPEDKAILEALKNQL